MRGWTRAHRLRCNVSEDDARRVNAAGGSLIVDVPLTIGREAQQPKHAVGDPVQNACPGVKGLRVVFVQLVAARVDDRALR